MTSRVFRSQMDRGIPSRPREETCPHVVEAHVEYDLPGSGYRAVLRCPCRHAMHRAPKVRERVADAEADARALLAAGVSSDILSATKQKPG